MTFRCTCPGLGVSPDCLFHMHDPSEDEPADATPGWVWTLDTQQWPYERVLSDDSEPGDLG